MAKFPSVDECRRLDSLGWTRVGVYVPPGVKAVIKAEAQWQKKTMSSLMWEIVVAIYLKAHDAEGKTLPELVAELKNDSVRTTTGHGRIRGVVEMARAERQRLYAEVQEFKKYERELLGKFEQEKREKEAADGE